MWVPSAGACPPSGALPAEPVGGLNPVGQPAALCPGGTNRLTGQLSHDYWGSSCDADEREEGGLFSKTVLPHAILAKAHMPDLAKVMPPFNVESIEARPSDMIDRASRKRVEFESIEFNKKFIATVARDHAPIAVREMFSPAFLAWAPTIDREVDFGVSDQQLYFTWRMRERSEAELETALDNAGELFKRVRREMEEHDVLVYKTGPWYAGLEPFPAGPSAT